MYYSQADSVFSSSPPYSGAPYVPSFAVNLISNPFSYFSYDQLIATRNSPYSSFAPVLPKFHASSMSHMKTWSGDIHTASLTSLRASELTSSGSSSGSSYGSDDESSIDWKHFLSSAEAAKRENMIKDARNLFQEGLNCAPHTSQIWCEYAKMEEEWGQLIKSKVRILF
jgi:hypothetical protein